MLHWSENLRKGLRKADPSASGTEYDWRLRETWEDYPVPDENAIHTYCEIAFEPGGKTFYYRTRNPELQVGDAVYVPVGYRREKKIGTIVSMKDYVGRDAPFPLAKTKHILDKAE